MPDASRRPVPVSDAERADDGWNVSDLLGVLTVLGVIGFLVWPWIAGGG